jgi:hypothetical protein
MTPNLNLSLDLSPDSRIWFYQTDRPITENERVLLSEKLNTFISSWAAHGDKLYGDFVFFNPHLLIIAIDDSKVPPSGCSIDSCTRFISELGKAFAIDFFVRTKALVLHDNQWVQTDFDSVASFPPTVLLLDPTVTRIHEFNSKGIVAPAESGLKHLF